MPISGQGNKPQQTVEPMIPNTNNIGTPKLDWVELAKVEPHERGSQPAKSHLNTNLMRPQPKLPSTKRPHQEED